MKGFSLIELLIVFVIAAVLLMIAVPGYRIYIANSTASSLAVDIASTFRLARNEAIRRAMSVKICGMNADTSCNDTAVNWPYGWKITVPSTGETIQVYIPKGTQAATINPASSIVLTSIGLILPNPNFVFTITPVGCTRGYLLTVAVNGQIQSQQIACP